MGLAWSPEGLYVSSHGKVSLLRDDDGDGRADREEVVASGWPPTDVPSGGVDALGVTLDEDGNLYFGLGTPDYSNAYRVEDGKARYDLKGSGARSSSCLPTASAGRSSPPASASPTPCFNRHGDLFATDQEGETWLPGGNPLDELNHIVPGRHYGFPPRHDTYLPGAIDEPPVVDFGPQHQSSCGLVFNEAKGGWKSFGPASWVGDAFVAGFSRGKVWRVKLVKTPHGYVGRPTLVAASDMMVADVAVSPSGALVPDLPRRPARLGQRPSGKGRLFQHHLRRPRSPAAGRRLAVRADGGPGRLRATARPGALRRAWPGPRSRSVNTSGPPTGTRPYKPPYKAVEEQRAAPIGTLHASEARLEDGGRTLVLATDPHPGAATYALTLPGVRGVGRAGSPGRPSIWTTT